MLSSQSQIDFNKTFADFTENSRIDKSANYPYNNFQNPKVLKTYSSFINNDKFTLNKDFVKEHNEIKEEKTYGKLYTAIAAVSAVAVGVMLHKGGKLFSIGNFFKKHASNVTTKILETAQKGEGMDLLQKLRYKLAVKTSSFFNKTKGFGNVNPFKDIFADRVLDKIGLKGMFDRITVSFTNYAKRLTASKYKVPQAELGKLNKLFSEAAESISKLPPTAFKSPKEAENIAKTLNQLSQLSSKELQSIVNGFGGRFDNIVTTLAKHSEPEFINAVKGAKGKTLWQTLKNEANLLSDFVPQKTMMPYKKEAFASLFASKRKISNSIIDLNKTMLNSLDDVYFNNSLENATLRKTYLNLKKLLNDFCNPKTCGVARGITREKIVEELGRATKELKNVNNSADKIQILNELTELVKTDKKGAIEQGVTLCKVLKKYKPELYNKLIQQRNTFQKSLNKAVEFESENTYGKLLDFSLHSLATDIFTQVTGISTLAYIWLNRKKSTQEKISANFKTGIPIIGGLGVAFLCNLRQVASGPAALFFGLVSSFILNRLGTAASNYYVNSKKQQEKTMVA